MGNLSMQLDNLELHQDFSLRRVQIHAQIRTSVRLGLLLLNRERQPEKNFNKKIKTQRKEMKIMKKKKKKKNLGRTLLKQFDGQNGRSNKEKYKYITYKSKAGIIMKILNDARPKI